MRGIAEIMAENATSEGRESYRFTVILDVDPKAVRDAYESDAPVEELLHGEMTSWFDSLDYVHHHDVRRKY